MILLASSLRVVMVLIFGIVPVGCAGTKAALEAKNQSGAYQVINVPLDDAYDIAARVIKFQGAKVKKIDRTNQLIVGEYGISPYGAGISYGAILGIYFDPAGFDKTAVKVVQKNRCKLCLTEKDYVDSFLTLLGQQALSHPRRNEENAKVVSRN